MAENLQLSPFDQSFPPIVSKRSPTARDRAELGTIWINTVLNDAFILTSVIAGVSSWINAGGGSGTFSSLNVSGTALIGGAATFSSTITASTFGRGLVFSSAAGLLSSAAGTNGQVVIGATGAAPLWASMASSDGSVGIAVGANTIDLTVTGATGSSFPTDGAVVTPLAGATSIVGDTNITTDGVVANTVTINLNPSVSVTGKLTAGNDLEMTAGTCLIASDDNAANAIYLHTTGGVNEQINIFADAGTGMQSIWMHSDVGGINLEAGVAAASAVLIEATNAAGGIGMAAGTGGIIAAVTNGVFTVETGTGAVSIGADAVAHNCTFGGTTGAAATTIQSGTGNLVQTSTGTITLDAAGVLELNSSAGIIGIGNDAIAQNINIGTGAAARTITIGNSSGASSVIVDVGTGNLDLGVTASAHTSRLGSTTGASATTVQAGTGALAINGGGAVTLDAVGALELNTSAGAINIATDAVAVVTTIGNVTGVSQVVVDCGTAGVSVGASATAHASIFGSTNTTSNTTVQSGTGALVLNGAGDVTIDAAGVLELNSSAGIISVGNDAIAQNINIGTGASARVITIGNNNTTTGVAVTSGTGDITLSSADAVILDAAGVLEINSSAGVIGIGNDAVAQNINIGTGAAARIITVGNNTTTTQVAITSGTGDITLNSQDAVTVQAVGAVDIDTAGVVSINSTAGALNIGNDANAQAINIGTGAAARTITVGNNTTTTAVNITAGSGEISCNTDVNLTTAGTGFVLQEGPKILAGSGAPAAVTAPKGSLYLNTAGSATNDRAYINTDGGTTWTAITTAA